MIDRLSLPLVSPAGMLRFGPPGSEVLKDFRVIAKLGEGPMGVVYRAHQVSQSREVVLKILAPRAAADAKVLERFLHEARTALTMDHPSLVRGLAVGEEHGLHYLALESLNGESVERCLSQVGQFSVGDTVRVVRDVGRGLQYAHARNIRHRDIRTSNIVVTLDGEVVLTDLGFAKILAERIEVTTRDEVNALGAILYELLTGNRPFAPETVYEALTAPALPPYEPVYRLNPSVPNAIDQLVARAMSRDPTRRYRDVGELVAALEATGLASETLEITAPDANRKAERAVTRLLRRRAALPISQKPPANQPRPRISGLAVAAGVVALVIVAAVVFWQFSGTVRPSATPGGRAVPVANAPRIDGEPVDAILARAVTQATNGDSEQARMTLSQGLQDHPGSAVLQRPLDELTQGVLIVFQYRTPDETSPRVPIWAATGLTLGRRDGYRFAIVPARPCHVYAFQRDARTGMSTIFPNERYAPMSNPVTPNTLYWLPSLADASIPTWLRVEAGDGEEHAYFVAVTKALRDPQAFGRRLLESSDGARTELMRDVDAFLVKGGLPGTACFASGGPVQSFAFAHR